MIRANALISIGAFKTLRSIGPTSKVIELSTSPPSVAWLTWVATKVLDWNQKAPANEPPRL